MSKRYPSFPALPALTALAVAAMILPSVVSAGSVGKGQRIMLVQKHRSGSPNGTFVFHALTSGPLDLDSGRYTLAAAEEPFVIRNGQGIAIYITIATLTGKRGTLVIRSRAEFVGAGNGSTVGTGAWSLLRGTGAYDGATGGGRVAVVVATPRGFTSSQYEGFLRAPAPS
jgi:hypothetical protein